MYHNIPGDHRSRFGQPPGLGISSVGFSLRLTTTACSYIPGRNRISPQAIQRRPNRSAPARREPVFPPAIVDALLLMSAERDLILAKLVQDFVLHDAVGTPVIAIPHEQWYP